MAGPDCSPERVARLENEARILRQRLLTLAEVVEVYLDDASKVDLLSEALEQAKKELKKTSAVK